MGYEMQRAIIVTTNSYDPEHGVDIFAARQKAVEIFSRRGKEIGEPLERLITPIFMGMVNHTRTFIINTSGSGLEWDTFAYHEKACSEFTRWMKTQTYEDKSCGLRWVWVQYGDDGGDTKVLDSRDDEFNRVRFNGTD